MRRVGVCSWSLRPRDPDDLAGALRAVGTPYVQLALDPLRDGRWDARATVRALGAAGATVISGMMGTVGEDYTTIESIRRTGGLRPDATFAANLAAARANAELAERLAIPLVTFHAGFLPADARAPERATMIERIRAVADAFAARGVAVALETGQEDAPTLLAVLDALGGDVGVNFDPANMLLYGTGDPIEALAALGPRVRQVHVKDARRSARAGAWGVEVRAGEGEVDWRAFFELLGRVAPDVDLVIEREAGDDRVGDARAAAALCAEHLR